MNGAPKGEETGRGGPIDSDVEGTTLLARFRESGEHVWSRGYGLGSPLGLGVTPEGSSVVVGQIGGKNGFVAWFTPEGSVQWEAFSRGLALPSQVGVDSARRVVIAGRFNGTIDWGNQSHVSS